MPNKTSFEPQGQALLEVTIASGLAIVVIAAIAVTTIIGLRNSQYAQNQIQATKLAQEGLEQVRVIKDRNCPVTDTGSVIYYWRADPANSTGNLVWNVNFIAPIFVISYNATQCSLTNGPAQSLANGRFTRTIALGPASVPDKVKVSAQVNWTDYSGTHQSQLVTIISKDI